MATLFPRIPADVAVQLYNEMVSASPEALQPRASTGHPKAYFLQTGGHAVRETELQRLSNEVTGIAAKHGYPLGRARQRLAAFDADTSAYLAERWPAAPGEALRPEAWAFVSAVMLPHLVKWRFPTLTQERVWGPLYRNTFGRLWLRGLLFDRGPDHADRWQLLSALNEDTFVSIVERPTLSGNPSVARALAEAWVTAGKALPGVSMEALNREVAKKVLLLSEPICFDVVDSAELQRTFTRMYLDTARIGVTRRAAPGNSPDQRATLPL